MTSFYVCSRGVRGRVVKGFIDLIYFKYHLPFTAVDSNLARDFGSFCHLRKIAWV
jgi:hypothetical protein